MHWTTELLNKYKEALVAFDSGEDKGKEFLFTQNLYKGICHWLYLKELKEAQDFVGMWAIRKTGNRFICPPPITFLGYWHQLPQIINGIKIRMQHLHKMREELNINEPLL
jgi:hypothetical protein